MKKIGIISYNRYCNFTNYGSALQSWALCQAVNQVSRGCVLPMLVDYCPNVLLDCDPLHPLEKMWDQDPESRRMCEQSLPAIRENYAKFERFYQEQFHRTSRKYTSENFESIIEEELNGFLCGSDTIFCIDEFKGFDDGYYANFPVMRRNYAVSYAASFGDAQFQGEDYRILLQRLKNFHAIGLRENRMIETLSPYVQVPLRRTLDPTLLLTSHEYDRLALERLEDRPYVLLYVRRYNPVMEAFTDRIARENGWRVIEISLRAVNAKKGHRMFYEAGVEEFLSMVKYAEAVVTNSFHGMIFSIQYRKKFYPFTREICDSKIGELLKLCGLEDHLLSTGQEVNTMEIDYDKVYKKIEKVRKTSLDFLNLELNYCPETVMQ